MLGMSIIVAMGVIFFLIKASWKIRITVFSYPNTVDFTLMILLFLFHGGTSSFSGGMVAAGAGMLVAAVLWVARMAFGYTVDPRPKPQGVTAWMKRIFVEPSVPRKYVRGWIDVQQKYGVSI